MRVHIHFWMEVVNARCDRTFQLNLEPQTLLDGNPPLWRPLRITGQPSPDSPRYLVFRNAADRPDRVFSDPQSGGQGSWRTGGWWKSGGLRGSDPKGQRNVSDFLLNMVTSEVFLVNPDWRERFVVPWRAVLAVESGGVFAASPSPPRFGESIVSDSREGADVGGLFWALLITTGCYPPSPARFVKAPLHVLRRVERRVLPAACECGGLLCLAAEAAVEEAHKQSYRLSPGFWLHLPLVLFQVACVSAACASQHRFVLLGN